MSYNQKPTKKYDNNYSGVLKRAERKSKNHPHYKGICTINETVYFISAWVNESDDGEKYMKLAFTPAPEKSAPKKVVKREVEDDYDYPF